MTVQVIFAISTEGGMDLSGPTPFDSFLADYPKDTAQLMAAIARETAKGIRHITPTVDEIRAGRESEYLRLKAWYNRAQPGDWTRYDMGAIFCVRGDET